MIEVGTAVLLLLFSILASVVLAADRVKKRYADRPGKEQTNSEGEDAQSSQSAQRTLTPSPRSKGYAVQTIAQTDQGILSGLTVLVADDNDVNITVLTEMLEHLGLERLIVTKDGEEVVEAAMENRVDIVYMDIQMPKMNGIDAAKKILSDHTYRSLPIIPITGFSRIVNASMCSEAGMTGFLQKPVDLDELRSATLRVLSKRRAA